MNFKPILFSTAMVQAILEGRKTMTRRIVKPQPKGSFCGVCNSSTQSKDIGGFGFAIDERIELTLKCPYGKVGDVLWVRESYCPGYFDSGAHGYKADWNKTAAEYVTEPKWKPSIHMPKSACRIFLKITDIRVERLQEISEDDATKEGIEQFTKDGVGFKYGIEGWHWSCNTGNPFMCRSRKVAFEELWSSINGEKSWNDNPWVWVISFEKIDKPTDFV